MSILSNLHPHPLATRDRKRVGRGPGSGTGKTSGKGHKGQSQHGRSPRPGFEGGQMPLIRTTPKRGFTARSRPRYQVVNLKDVAALKSDSVVDEKVLYEKKLVRSKREPIKILGEGELTQAIHVRVHAASRSAVEKIQKAGGKLEQIEWSNPSKKAQMQGARK